MKTTDTEFTKIARDSLVFSFEDYDSDNPLEAKEILENNFLDESETEILDATEKENIEVEKNVAGISSTNFEENGITSLLAENVNDKDYLAKWSFILKNGYEAYITSKNKTL